MAEKTVLLSTKEPKGRQEVAETLKQIAEKIAGGKLTLKSGSDNVALDMPEQLILEVKVSDKPKKTKGMQHELEIEIKWYDEDMPGGTLELE